MLIPGSGPNGLYIGKDFRAAYCPGVSLDGSGQTIGIAAFSDFYLSDITHYDNVANLPNISISKDSVVPITGPNMNPFEDVETCLDIEMVHSMAPGAIVKIYEAPYTLDDNWLNFNNILQTMANDTPRQFSSSVMPLGGGDQDDSPADKAFKEMAVQGQSFFQASGDNGANHIILPEDNPYITIVGGTVLKTKSPGGTWSSESVWSQSGGGTSSLYSMPIWQQGSQYPYQYSKSMHSRCCNGCIQYLRICR